jgi:hypothetical protein
MFFYNKLSRCSVIKTDFNYYQKRVRRLMMSFIFGWDFLCILNRENAKFNAIKRERFVNNNANDKVRFLTGNWRTSVVFVNLKGSSFIEVFRLLKNTSKQKHTVQFSWGLSAMNNNNIIFIYL